MDRRALLSTLGAGGAAALAGCSGAFTVTERAEAGRGITFDATTVDDDALDGAAFAAHVEEMHGTYGSLGVYGRAGPDPAHGLPFAGAWTGSLAPGGGVESAHALVLHRLPESPGGTAAAAVWLWSAADPRGADGATVERVATAVDLPEDATMGVYDPGGDVRSDRADGYMVRTPRPDADGLAVSMPLPAGRVTVDPEGTRVGEGGGYAPVWRGSHDGRVAVAATCELRWPADGSVSLDWSVAVETG
jgi:hypothetical protein